MSEETEPEKEATATRRPSRAEQLAEQQEAFERFLASQGQVPWSAKPQYPNE